jgi:hypothetical protein
MPWLGLPYTTNTTDRESIYKLLKVDRIPSLIIMNEDGTVANRNGVPLIEVDPLGLEFPYPERSYQELVQDLVCCNHNEKGSCGIEGKYVGLLFDHPSEKRHAKISSLKKLYEAVTRNASYPFEIIYIGQSRGLSEFKDAIKDMPWLSIAFKNSYRAYVYLTTRYRFEFLGPEVVMLGPMGETINETALQIMIEVLSYFS